MTKATSFSGVYPWHTLLLALFCVIHKTLQYAGLVSFGAVVEAFFIFLFIEILVFAVSFFLLRKLSLCWQITTVLSALLFLFGPIKDLLFNVQSLRFLSAYTFIVPLLSLVAFGLLVVLRRVNGHKRIDYYLNLLLLIWVVTDLLSITMASQSMSQRNQLTGKWPVSVKEVPADKQKPDVYLLVFDCYPSSAYLKQYMQFDNEPFDRTLRRKGFFVVPKTASNYNRTAFSMCSELNGQYLAGLTGKEALLPMYYNKALLSMRSAAVPALFERLGYRFVNLSIFDMAGSPALFKETFLAYSALDMLLFDTFFMRAKNDLSWIWRSRHSDQPVTADAESDRMFEELARKRSFNNLLQDTLKSLAREATAEPRFIYAHFYIPHPPFFYDSNGRPNNLSIVSTKEGFRNRQLFLSYLQYGNKVIDSLSSALINVPGKKPVVLVQGDHGFVDFEGGPHDTSLLFKNYISFYFPDQDYRSLPDSITSVNIFPMIFNHLYNAGIPLRPDSSFVLKY